MKGHLEAEQTRYRLDDNSCYFGQKIDEYIDGELGQNLNQFMRDHLESCSSCQTQYQMQNVLLERIRHQIPKLDLNKADLDEMKQEVNEIIKSYRQQHGPRSVQDLFSFFKRLIAS